MKGLRKYPTKLKTVYYCYCYYYFYYGRKKIFSKIKDLFMRGNFFKNDFIMEKQVSIGLKSGEYAGKYSSRIPLQYIISDLLNSHVEFTHRPSIVSRMPGTRCTLQLSITITEFGPGYGFISSRSSFMNSRKAGPLKEPTVI